MEDMEGMRQDEITKGESIHRRRGGQGLNPGSLPHEALREPGSNQQKHRVERRSSHS